MKNQKGFSLIELLIVVVIIGIIAAIAIPNLLSARRSANEGSAVSTLRTIHGGQMTYQATAGAGNYGFLSDLAGQSILDNTFAGATSATIAANKSGYAFTSNKFDAATGASPNPASFAVLAKPTSASGVTATGTRNFGIATDGVLASQAAGSTTPMALAGSAANGATYGAGSAMGN